ncbi:MAG: UbiX family flavin prenyltransferase [Candidatus Altiarchaeota archaeon]|nr:UbiX family flavin prenyltransferase [Candidatus Altiarchaeota archaeon]
MKIIVGVTGASGVILAKRLLEVLKQRRIETHLVITEEAELIIKHELGKDDPSRLATYTHPPQDFYATISSGSFKVDGMVVVPCSMKTVGAIANGISHNLLVRAADVCLKQDRKLVLVPRETPLSLVHLRNLVAVKEAGAIILPPIMAFYPKPKDINDMVDFVVGKILDSLGIDNDMYRRWGG